MGICSFGSIGEVVYTYLVSGATYQIVAFQYFGYLHTSIWSRCLSLYHTRAQTLTDEVGPEGWFYDRWDGMERPLVMMISRMIQCKGLVPHAIVWAKLGAAPIVVEALFQVVT